MRIGDELPLRIGLLLGKAKVKKAESVGFVRSIRCGINLEGGTMIVACERPKSTGIGLDATAYSMPFMRNS